MKNNYNFGKKKFASWAKCQSLLKNLNCLLTTSPKILKIGFNKSNARRLD